ncbi:hypothetical protein BC833DRAFT_653103 [Globomyces pollinis-pini]|nr:hypothetical protein BC833DRAFT_653103 [Globomyces pollinis-pini]
MDKIKSNKVGKKKKEKKLTKSIPNKVIHELDHIQNDSIQNTNMDSDQSSIHGSDIESDTDIISKLTTLDPFHLQFHQSQSDAILKKSVKVDAKQFVPDAITHPLLMRIVSSTLNDSNAVSEVQPDSTLSDLMVKKKLIPNWLALNNKLLKKTGTTSFTPLQAAMFTYINAYQDVFYSNNNYQFEADRRHLLAFHAMNHVMKSNDRIYKNSARIKAEIAENKEVSDLRDQGFTKPKVLILLPFKNHAFNYIKDLITLSGATQLEHKKRFMDEFGSEPSKGDPRKSDDYNRTFAGNIDDCFKIGLRFSGRQLKLYSSFYSSDIIVASPLGLEMIIGSEGDKKRDFDFLAGIEVVISDFTEIFLMQNWDHVRHIFDHLNLIPKDSHGCDFSRIRNYVLDGKAKYVRQHLFFSSFNSPEINSIASLSSNIAGKVKISQQYAGNITDVVVQIPQVFHRIPQSSLAEASNTRFNFFVNKMLPNLRHGTMHQSHTLIFIPSYFDFIRVRNYLKEHNYSSTGISEYSSKSKVDVSRNEFISGDIKFLLYSERYHFFRRNKLKGAKHILFYGPPVFPYYAEFVNKLGADGLTDATCSLMFDQYDRLGLERIVGSERCDRMIKGSKEAYMFSV